MKNQGIDLAGVAAIPEERPFHIPIVPGFTVLTGENGEGKSETLDAVQALVSGEGSLSVNRSSLAGYVRGLGVEITVGRQTRRSGELVVKSLRGLNPMEVVDPGIKDPVAADGQRIRVLSKLVGAQLTHDDFARLLPGGADELREIVTHKTLAVEGAPEMAGAFERDFQLAARTAEEEAKVQEGRAEGLRQSNENVDLEGACDEAELATARESALRSLHTAEGEANSARARRTKTAAARARLEAAANERGGIPSTSARSRIETARGVRAIRLEESKDADAKAARLLTEYREAKAIADIATERANSSLRDVEAAEALLVQALDGERSLEEARKLAESDPGEAGPSDQDLADLRVAVDVASRAEKNGVSVREAKERAKEAEAAGLEALEHRQRARIFREAAANCDELLSAAIQKLAPAGIKIRSGRLHGPNKHGELVVFDELSDGERLHLVLPLAIAAVGPNGLMVMPQRNYQDLDPINRAAIQRILVENGATIVTAVAGTGELRVESKNGNGAS